MKPNVTELEAMTVLRALAREEAQLPFAVSDGKGNIRFVEMLRDDTSVVCTCGCGATVVLVNRNIVTVAVNRCRHHLATTGPRQNRREWREVYAVLGSGSPDGAAFAPLKPEAEKAFAKEMHAPVVREESDVFH